MGYCSFCVSKVIVIKYKINHGVEKTFVGGDISRRYPYPNLVAAVFASAIIKGVDTNLLSTAFKTT